jgi:hypothetical protein
LGKNRELGPEIYKNLRLSLATWQIVAPSSDLCLKNLAALLEQDIIDTFKTFTTDTFG